MINRETVISVRACGCLFFVENYNRNNFWKCVYIIYKYNKKY